MYRVAAAVRGLHPSSSAFSRSDMPIAPPSRGTIAGRVVLERRAVQIADIASDPEYTESRSA